MGFIPKTSPIDLLGEASTTTFYGDIPYTLINENIFDIFIPDSPTPTGLVIFFHGGSFLSGSKTQGYSGSREADVIEYLQNNIAFATVDYRLIRSVIDREGVIKSLSDGELALNFIKANAAFFNIDITKIALDGGSAGGGIAQYVGYKAANNIAGVAMINSQATYDMIKWNDVLSDYSFDTLAFAKQINAMRSLFNFYGISSQKELFLEPIITYRKNVDMLVDLPTYTGEIWLNSSLNDTDPVDLYEVLHHPQHGVTVRDLAIANGITIDAEIQSQAITSTEDRMEFLIRITT